jgi:hypothetical protein
MKVRMTAKEKGTETVCQQDLCWDYIGDNNDEDDDSVELRGNNAVPPSGRDNQILTAGIADNLGAGMLDPGMLLTMECLHPETLHLLAVEVAPNLEIGTPITVEGILHQETIHSVATNMAA